MAYELSAQHYLPRRTFRLGPRIYHRRDIFPRAVLRLTAFHDDFSSTTIVPSFFFSFFLPFFRRTFASRVFSSSLVVGSYVSRIMVRSSRNMEIFDRVRVSLDWSAWKIVGVGINRFTWNFEFHPIIIIFSFSSCNFPLCFNFLNASCWISIRLISI